MKTVFIVLAVLFTLWLLKRLVNRLMALTVKRLRASPNCCGFCFEFGKVAYLYNSKLSEDEPTYTCEACCQKIFRIGDAKEWALENGRLIRVAQKDGAS